MTGLQSQDISATLLNEGVQELGLVPERVATIRFGPPGRPTNLGDTAILRATNLTDRYRIENAVAIVRSGVATFDNLRVIPVSYAVSNPDTLWLQLTIGQVTSTLRVPVRVRWPAGALHLSLRMPDTMALEASYPVAVLATAAAPGGDLPIRNAAVLLKLPGRAVGANESTGDDGVANFESVALSSVKVGRVNIGVSSAGFRSATKAITVLPGPIARVEIERTLPARVGVGMPLGITVSVRDAAGNGVPDQQVRVSVLRPGGSLFTDTLVTTTSRGSAASRFEYRGPSGRVTVSAQSATFRDSIILAMDPGDIPRLELIQDVEGQLIPDSILKTPLVLRVTDYGGNALGDVPVRVQLCWNIAERRQHKAWFITLTRGRPATQECASANERRDTDRSLTRPFMRGEHRRLSRPDGTVRFDSLRILGPSGRYWLKASVEGSRADSLFSGYMLYDSYDVFDRSFVVLSAIKSVSGTAIPENEFFDLRFQFRIKPWLHVAVNSDIALSRKSTSDSVDVRGTQDRLVDAAVALNIRMPFFYVRDELTEAPERYPFFGFQVRVFNTVPYAAFHIGNVELVRSILHGSSLTIGYARAFDPTPVMVAQHPFRPARHNFVVDGFIRSSGIDFFKFLNIRGTVMLPLGETGRRPTSRIAISVPIGGIVPF